MGLKYLTGGLGLALLATLVVSALIIWGLNKQLEHVQSKLGTATIRVAALEGANKQCESSIEVQNAAVQNWVDTSKAATTEALTAARNAWGVVRRAQSVSEDLLKQKSTGDLLKDCQRLGINLDAAIQRRQGAQK